MSHYKRTIPLTTPDISTIPYKVNLQIPDGCTFTTFLAAPSYQKVENFETTKLQNLIDNYITQYYSLNNHILVQLSTQFQVIVPLIQALFVSIRKLLVQIIIEDKILPDELNAQSNSHLFTPNSSHNEITSQNTPTNPSHQSPAHPLNTFLRNDNVSMGFILPQIEKQLNTLNDMLQLLHNSQKNETNGKKNQNNLGQFPYLTPPNIPTLFSQTPLFQYHSIKPFGFESPAESQNCSQLQNPPQKAPSNLSEIDTTPPSLTLPPSSTHFTTINDLNRLLSQQWSFDQETGTFTAKSAPQHTQNNTTPPSTIDGTDEGTGADLDPKNGLFLHNLPTQFVEYIKSLLSSFSTAISINSGANNGQNDSYTHKDGLVDGIDPQTMVGTKFSTLFRPGFHDLNLSEEEREKNISDWLKDLNFVSENNAFDFGDGQTVGDKIVQNRNHANTSNPLTSHPNHTSLSPSSSHFFLHLIYTCHFSMSLLQYYSQKSYPENSQNSQNSQNLPNFDPQTTPINPAHSSPSPPNSLTSLPTRFLTVLQILPQISIRLVYFIHHTTIFNQFIQKSHSDLISSLSSHFQWVLNLVPHLTSQYKYPWMVISPNLPPHFIPQSPSLSPYMTLPSRIAPQFDPGHPLYSSNRDLSQNTTSRSDLEGAMPYQFTNQINNANIISPAPDHHLTPAQQLKYSSLNVNYNTNTSPQSIKTFLSFTNCVQDGTNFRALRNTLEKSFAQTFGYQLRNNISQRTSGLIANTYAIVSSPSTVSGPNRQAGTLSGHIDTPTTRFLKHLHLDTIRSVNGIINKRVHDPNVKKSDAFLKHNEYNDLLPIDMDRNGSDIYPVGTMTDNCGIGGEKNDGKNKKRKNTEKSVEKNAILISSSFSSKSSSLIQHQFSTPNPPTNNELLLLPCHRQSYLHPNNLTTLASLHYNKQNKKTLKQTPTSNLFTDFPPTTDPPSVFPTFNFTPNSPANIPFPPYPCLSLENNDPNPFQLSSPTTTSYALPPDQLLWDDAPSSLFFDSDGRHIQSSDPSHFSRSQPHPSLLPLLNDPTSTSPSSGMGHFSALSNMVHAVSQITGALTTTMLPTLGDRKKIVLSSLLITQRAAHNSSTIGSTTVGSGGDTGDDGGVNGDAFPPNNSDDLFGLWSQPLGIPAMNAPIPAIMQLDYNWGNSHGRENILNHFFPDRFDQGKIFLLNQMNNFDKTNQKEIGSLNAKNTNRIPSKRTFGKKKTPSPNGSPNSTVMGENDTKNTPQKQLQIINAKKFEKLLFSHKMDLLDLIHFSNHSYLLNAVEPDPGTIPIRSTHYLQQIIPNQLQTLAQPPQNEQYSSNIASLDDIDQSDDYFAKDRLRESNLSFGGEIGGKQEDIDDGNITIDEKTDNDTNCLSECCPEQYIDSTYYNNILNVEHLLNGTENCLKNDQKNDNFGYKPFFDSFCSSSDDGDDGDDGDGQNFDPHEDLFNHSTNNDLEINPSNPHGSFSYQPDLSYLDRDLIYAQGNVEDIITSILLKFSSIASFSPSWIPPQTDTNALPGHPLYATSKPVTPMQTIHHYCDVNGLALDHSSGAVSQLVTLLADKLATIVNNAVHAKNCPGTSGGGSQRERNCQNCQNCVGQKNKNNKNNKNGEISLRNEIQNNCNIIDDVTAFENNSELHGKRDVLLVSLLSTLKGNFDRALKLGDFSHNENQDKDSKNLDKISISQHLFSNFKPIPNTIHTQMSESGQFFTQLIETYKSLNLYYQKLIQTQRNYQKDEKDEKNDKNNQNHKNHKNTIQTPLSELAILLSPQPCQNGCVDDQKTFLATHLQSQILTNLIPIFSPPPKNIPQNSAVSLSRPQSSSNPAGIIIPNLKLSRSSRYGSNPDEKIIEKNIFEENNDKNDRKIEDFEKKRQLYLKTQHDELLNEYHINQLALRAYHGHLPPTIRDYYTKKYNFILEKFGSQKAQKAQKTHQDDTILPSTVIDSTVMDKLAYGDNDLGAVGGDMKYGDDMGALIETSLIPTHQDNFTHSSKQLLIHLGMVQAKPSKSQEMILEKLSKLDQNFEQNNLPQNQQQNTPHSTTMNDEDEIPQTFKISSSSSISPADEEDIFNLLDEFDEYDYELEYELDNDELEVLYQDCNPLMAKLNESVDLHSLYNINPIQPLLDLSPNPPQASHVITQPPPGVTPNIDNNMIKTENNNFNPDNSNEIIAPTALDLMIPPQRHPITQDQANKAKMDTILSQISHQTTRLQSDYLNSTTPVDYSTAYTQPHSPPLPQIQNYSSNSFGGVGKNKSGKNSANSSGQVSSGAGHPIGISNVDSGHITTTTSDLAPGLSKTSHYLNQPQIGLPQAHVGNYLNYLNQHAGFPHHLPPTNSQPNQTNSHPDFFSNFGQICQNFQNSQHHHHSQPNFHTHQTALQLKDEEAALQKHQYFSSYLSARHLSPNPVPLANLPVSIAQIGADGHSTVKILPQTVSNHDLGVIKGSGTRGKVISRKDNKTKNGHNTASLGSTSDNVNTGPASFLLSPVSLATKRLKDTTNLDSNFIFGDYLSPNEYLLFGDDDYDDELNQFDGGNDGIEEDGNYIGYQDDQDWKNIEEKSTNKEIGSKFESKLGKNREKDHKQKAQNNIPGTQSLQYHQHPSHVVSRIQEPVDVPQYVTLGPHTTAMLAYQRIITDYFEVSKKIPSVMPSQNYEILQLIPLQSVLDKHNGVSYSDGQQNNECYCFCQTQSMGEMVCCENNSCPYEWFHFQCVGLSTAPRGAWYCLYCILNKLGKRENKIKITPKIKNMGETQEFYLKSVGLFPRATNKNSTVLLNYNLFYNFVPGLNGDLVPLDPPLYTTPSNTS